MKKTVKIGITSGDINGIGIELILKTFQDSRMLDGITPVIYGSAKSISFYKKMLGVNFQFSPVNDSGNFNSNKINLVNVTDEEVKINCGVSTQEGGKFAFDCLKTATDDLAASKIDALVTAPINKKNIQSKDFDFPGHTEYLTKLSNVENSLMFMVSDLLKVGIVTNHVPVKDIAKHLSKDAILTKIQLMSNSLTKDFKIIKPKIAVLGLNPHSGDNGLIGDEESKVIIPAIQAAEKEGILAFGPYPGDGFFGSGNFKNFDGVLAMYHDQGLIPFKSLSGEYGVNYTAGLPITRTSPDHGTAYEIAGKNLANVNSFRSAIFTACDIVRNRNLN